MPAPRHAAPKPAVARAAAPQRPAASPPVVAAIASAPTAQQAFSYASSPVHSPTAAAPPPAANTGPAKAPPIVHDVLRGAGAALEEGTRAAMEERLGHDLSGVRVHTDDQAAASARAVNALAYTVGKSIVFDCGRYAPQQPDGRSLLVHELVHTIQQGGPAVSTGGLLRIDAVDSAAEREADELADAPDAAQTEMRRPASGSTPLAVARRIAGPDDPDKDGYCRYAIKITSTTKSEDLLGILLDKHPELSRGSFWESGHAPAITKAQFANKTVFVRVKVAPSDAEKAALKAKLKALPSEARELLMPDGADAVPPRDHEKILRIAAKFAGLSAEELADYMSKIEFGTGSLTDVEASIDAYIRERDERARERDTREAAKTRLYGLEAVYAKYKVWKAGLPGLDTPGITMRATDILMRPLGFDLLGDPHLLALLDAHGFKTVDEFEQAIENYEKAFETETVRVGLDLLAQYGHVLHEEQKKFSNIDNAARLHADVAESLAASRDAAAEREQAQLDAMLQSPQIEAKKDNVTVVKNTQQRVAPAATKLGTADPLVTEKGFDLGALAGARSPQAVQNIMLAFIADRQGDIARMRDELGKDASIIYKLPQLLEASRRSQGIVDGSIYASILDAKLARVKRDQDLIDALVLVVSVALVIVSGGLGTPAVLAQIGLLALDTYLAIEALDTYNTGDAASHVGFLAEHPGFGWVIFAFVGAGFSIAGAVKAIAKSEKLIKAVTEFNHGGKIVELEEAIKSTDLLPQVQENVAKQARAQIDYDAAIKSLASGALHADPVVGASFAKTLRLVYFGSKRGIASFEGFMLSLKQSNLVSKAGLSAEELTKLKAAFEEARAGASELKSYGKGLGLAEDKVDDVVKQLDEGSTIDDAVAKLDEAAGGTASVAAAVIPTTNKYVRQFLIKFQKVSRSPDSIAALEELYTRTGRRGADLVEAAEFIPVQSRAAAQELRTIIEMNSRSQVKLIEIVPSSNAGRSADLFIHEFGSTTGSRLEIRTITGAKRGKVAVGAGGTKTTTVSQIKAAVLDKALPGGGKESQLVAEMGGRPKGGTLAIHMLNVGSNAATDVKLAMSSLSSRLSGASHLHGVDFYLPKGGLMRFVRSGQSYVLLP